MLSRICYGVIPGLAVSGALAGWVNKQAAELPEEQQGSLLTRTLEVAGAWIRAQGMEHGQTAKHHPKIVAQLPSEEFCKQLDRKNLNWKDGDLDKYSILTPKEAEVEAARTQFKNAAKTSGAVIFEQVGIDPDNPASYRFLTEHPQNRSRLMPLKLRERIATGDYFFCERSLNSNRNVILLKPDPAESFKSAFSPFLYPDMESFY